MEYIELDIPMNELDEELETEDAVEEDADLDEDEDDEVDLGDMDAMDDR